MLMRNTSTRCPKGSERPLVRCALSAAALLVFLAGCATNSVTTLMRASKRTDPIMPSAERVEVELKGRAFEVGRVAFDLQKAADKQGPPDIPDSAYLELFDSQLRKAFTGATLGSGTMPAYPVNVAIEELKLRPARFPIPEISTFRVRMEIAGANGAILLRGQFRSYLSGPAFMVITTGVVVPVALPAEGWERVALAKMFPATALVTAVTTQGLQQGKTLDKIRIYPQDIEAGNMISPDLFLKSAPFGMTEMDYKEIAWVIRAAQVGGERQGHALDSTGPLERKQ